MSELNVKYNLRAISLPKNWFAYYVDGWTIDDPQQEFVLPSTPRVIVELVLNNCRLNCFPARLSEFFPELKILRARNCELKSVAKQDFFGLNNLVRLDLSFNCIESLADDVFAHTPKL